MIAVRKLETGDVDAASAVLFHAFASVYRQRGHTPPFPNVDSAVWLAAPTSTSIPRAARSRSPRRRRRRRVRPPARRRREHRPARGAAGRAAGRGARAHGALPPPRRGRPACGSSRTASIPTRSACTRASAIASSTSPLPRRRAPDVARARAPASGVPPARGRRPRGRRQRYDLARTGAGAGQ